MNNKKQILITGSNGLCGSALREISKNYIDKYDFVFIDHHYGDLREKFFVEWLLSSYHPNYIINTAAKVSGLGGNMAEQETHLYDNLLINAHLIHFAVKYKVEKLLAFSSVCVFPDNCGILREDKMHQGEPYKLNFAYASAKRMIDFHIRASKSQFGISNFCSIVPSNIIGKNDYYNLNSAHLLPSLIHKIYLAKKNNTPLYVWGDGLSMREFIYADDLARILLDLIEMENIPERLIIAGDKEYSIRDIVGFLVEVAEFKGEVIYQPNQPNGQRSRKSDLTLFNSLFSDFKRTPIKDVIKISWSWFNNNYPNIRK